MANAMGEHGPSLLGHLYEEPRCIKCHSCLANSFDARTPTPAHATIIAGMDVASELIVEPDF